MTKWTMAKLAAPDRLTCSFDRVAAAGAKAGLLKARETSDPEVIVGGGCVQESRYRWTNLHPQSMSPTSSNHSTPFSRASTMTREKHGHMFLNLNNKP